MENTLKMWKARQLIILSKILVAKSQALLNINYSFSNVEVESIQLSQNKKLTNTFVWGRQHYRVKHSSLTTNYKSGRLQMTDLKCTMQSLRMT